LFSSRTKFPDGAKQRHFNWLSGPPDIQLINKLVDDDSPHVVFYCQEDLGDWDGTHIDLMAMCHEQSLLILDYARGAFSSGFSCPWWVSTPFPSQIVGQEFRLEQ
jgi:hypothetical protein